MRGRAEVSRENPISELEAALRSCSQPRPPHLARLPATRAGSPPTLYRKPEGDFLS